MRSGELSANWILRSLLLLQIAIFLSAVSIHFGLLLNGYQHRAAGTAESVIAAVLLAGFVLTWTPSPWSRRAAIAAQAFGVLGVIVGVFTIVVGVGPRTVLDVAVHAAMLLALIAGLGVALRQRWPQP